MPIAKFVPLVEATRGEIVECTHLGQITIVDSAGRLLAANGDPNLITYMRSSAKPLQVIPMVEDGGVKKFNLTEEELAIMCASHHGDEDHVRVIRSIQQKLEVGEEALLCGMHAPVDSKASEALLLKGEKPGPNHHNCSGKHMGMLANAILHGFPLSNYIEKDHPLQQLIIKTLAEIWEMPAEEIVMGIDGCSVPVFAIPMHKAAHGFAKLVDPKGFPEQRSAACRKIVSAMMAFPKMVSGETGFDTALMRAARGKVISKSGADGYQIAAVLPGVIHENSPGIAVVVKIMDGDARMRARSLVILETLRKLGAVTEEELEKMEDFYIRPVRNWKKMDVGELRPCFDLDI